MPNPADFYKINFEKEVNLQGRSTLFVSIEANEEAGDWTSNEAFWVAPLIQPQTFESKFEAWTYVPIKPPQTQLTGGNRFYFRESDFAKSGIEFSEAAWDSIKPGDSVKAVTMYRRTQDGESIAPLLTGGPGPIDVLRFETTVTAKGITQVFFGLAGTPETLYFVDVTPTSGLIREQKLGESFMMQIGSWYADDNWYINQTNAAEVAEKTLKSAPPIFYSTNVGLGINQFDGQNTAELWPRGGNFRYRYSAGSPFNPWASYAGGSGSNPRITWRIDYDGINNSHLKINFLIAKTNILGESPTVWDPTTVAQFDGSDVLYGQKLGLSSSAVIDYQELHLFGYTETEVRTNRTIYQNEYPTLNEEIYDDLSSFGVLKTNPKITGNVKLTIDSGGSLWLNTIDASQELSDAQYKKYPVSSNTSYQTDLFKFLNQGTLPSDLLYRLYQKDDQYLNTKRSFADQYDNFYNYGVEQLKSRFYDEDFSFFAPLWMRKVLPEFFIIFRVDHPINPLSYEEATTLDKFQEFFKDSRIIKTFDMRESSPLGTYLRKITGDPRYVERPLEVSFDKDVQTTWFGIDYASGSITGKGEYLYDFFNSDSRILDFEETITGGFERNGIISTNLINLEFLFNDEEATPYSINRYYGFYVTENQLAEFEIDPAILGAINGQTPVPTNGSEGEPYASKPFFQTNATGIQLPIDYYHSPSGVANTSSTPGYQGLTVGKFPLPSLVDDPLRIFYVKDRNGIFKRINKLSEVDYGNVSSPDYKRVTQLQLFDTYENISDYGGLTQMASQTNASLLDGGNAQLVVYIEDLLNSGEPIADDETFDIVLKKLNTDRRDYYYKLECTGNVGANYSYDVYVPDYSTNSIVCTLFLTSFVLNTTIAPAAFYIDSYLQGTLSGTPTITDVYNVHINDGNVVETTTNNVLVSIVFYGTPNYTSYRWRITANSLGLLPGNAWDYPVADPFGRDFNNVFSNKGTPAQVAQAITKCVNSFENRIVEAYAKDDAVYFKSLKKYEDGNSISVTRNMVLNKSVIRNVGFYEKCNVIRGEFTASYTNISGDTTQPVVFLNDYTEVLTAKTILVNTTPVVGGYAINITDTFVTSYIVNQDGILVTPEYTINVEGIAASSFTLSLQYGNQKAEQYFVGGVQRNRARAKLGLTSAQRYYTDRKISITGDTATGSSTITNSSILTSVYVGAPIVGAGIPANTIVTHINLITNEITISKDATATAIGIEIAIGELSIVNDSIIYQQWFQVQKENFSRLKGWDVQGKYVYSLPDLEAEDITDYDLYSIVQIDRDNSEFYLTFDQKIVAYQVYRPTLGIFSLFPIKTFDVDTYFSEYSYAPTIELFRYFNREEAFGNTLLSLSNEDPLSLNMGENYSITIATNDNTSTTETIDVEMEMEVYDTNDSTWKFVDRIIYKAIRNPAGYLATLYLPFTSENAKAVSSVLINTFYPTYFYDTMEVPNDLGSITSPRGPFNYENAEPNVLGQDQANKGPQYSAVGTRNFVRKVLHTDGNTEGRFTKARIGKTTIWEDYALNIPFTVGLKYTITAQSANYYNDTNIQRFPGFSTLADFVTENDLDQIQKYSDEQSFDKFTYQMLLSEYDRLRENNQKDLATKSKVVPSILKWVQEGTDARDNYYRLNNSTAFGITNFSPDSEVDFTEPLLLTHEFPYLDNVPKDYPEESLESSRSYFFQKLSDIAYDGKSWYELLTTDKTFDWFGKYFVVGYPNELSANEISVPKNREERYTFFNYINGLGLSQTLFRGAKINIIDYDTTLTPKVPINESERFNNYRFAAIARFVAHNNFEEEKPIQIEVIDNEVHKTILVVITIYAQDYRLSAGLGDYSFFYYAIDQLRNSMNTQWPSGYGTVSEFLKAKDIASFPVNTPDMKYPLEMPYSAWAPYGLSRMLSVGIGPGGSSIPPAYAGNYFPYTPVFGSQAWSIYAVDVNQAYNIQRPRQLFLGGGRLELDDTKLGGKVWISNTESVSGLDSVAKVIFQPLANPTDGTLAYPNTNNSIDYYPIYKEIFPTQDNYRSTIIDNYLGGSIKPAFNIVIPQVDLPFTPTTMTIDGTLSELSTSAKQISGLRFPLTYYIYDTRLQPEDVKLDAVTLPTGISYAKFNNPNSNKKINAIVNKLSTVVSITVPQYPPYSYINEYANLMPATNYAMDQAFNLRGGSLFYQERKNFISYANIFKMFNTRSTYILHRKVTAAGSFNQAIPDFELQFVTFDKLKKTTKCYYKDDDDKPLEYQNTDFIGYDLVNTNEQEYEFRHRGLYEPKMLEIVSFWAREDETFTRHFEKDYVLRNTHINGSSVTGGLIRNYFFTKVSDAEILRIARTSAYKSLYPMIGEIAIDKKNVSALDSSWDSGFYRKYTATQEYTDVEGTQEMQETKVFLASKAMAVPKSFDFGNFDATEVNFLVIKPKKSVGVKTLDTSTVGKSNQEEALQSKPILQIKIDLQKRLKRALLAGILESGSFDEFAWFNSLGIAAITYTPAELNALKAQYIEKNIIPLYKVESIKLYANSKEGLPVLDLVLTEAEKLSAGYREDKNVKNTAISDYVYTLEKVLDTKAPNSFSLSAVLKRI